MGSESYKKLKFYITYMIFLRCSMKPSTSPSWRQDVVTAFSCVFCSISSASPCGYRVLVRVL